MIRPKKSLGQHFLRDANIARNIVALLDPQPGETILEIGPGTGALTRFLGGKGARVFAVEIDARAAGILGEHFPPGGDIAILHGDILETDLATIAGPNGDKLRVIGNLPYFLSSRILFHLFDQAGSLRDAVLMLQREVARRLAAEPGNKEYGILSVMARLHADTRIAMHVPPTAFRPPPKVWSSVVHMTFRKDRSAAVADIEFFRRLVRSAFGQRRKRLANALSAFADGFVSLPPELAALLAGRAEERSLEEFIALANALTAAQT
ncbi:MAG: 16S rRNA (adenine(1518)-N(6)/adenine(1519)-N(6))-dimethyltransferase RsmA [Bacteroidota bacterium]|nr:16S rRNA (adenine(1518)-N(6)/adenine(1519)-N(6))-dimethyltransferase RsmA [Bacteroidota bacterium]